MFRTLHTLHTTLGSPTIGFRSPSFKNPSEGDCTNFRHSVWSRPGLYSYSCRTLGRGVVLLKLC
jgi:hypothetical protein